MGFPQHVHYGLDDSSKRKPPPRIQNSDVAPVPPKQPPPAPLEGVEVFSKAKAAAPTSPKATRTPRTPRTPRPKRLKTQGAFKHDGVDEEGKDGTAREELAEVEKTGEEGNVGEHEPTEEVKEGIGEGVEEEVGGEGWGHGEGCEEEELYEDDAPVEE